MLNDQGNFMDDQYHGKGTFYFKDGRIYDVRSIFRENGFKMKNMAREAILGQKVTSMW